MNYDITFCEGKNCSRKEECHRYKELLRFRADKDPNRKNYISITKPENPIKCSLFWEGKMNKRNLLAMLAGYAMIAAQYDDSFRPTPKRQKPYSDNSFSDRIPKAVDSRQLREFSIKGHKIMAYSKKDALTRLKHKKKI